MKQLFDAFGAYWMSADGQSTRLWMSEDDRYSELYGDGRQLDQASFSTRLFPDLLGNAGLPSEIGAPLKQTAELLLKCLSKEKNAIDLGMGMAGLAYGLGTRSVVHDARMILEDLRELELISDADADNLGSRNSAKNLPSGADLPLPILQPANERVRVRFVNTPFGLALTEDDWDKYRSTKLGTTMQIVCSHIGIKPPPDLSESELPPAHEEICRTFGIVDAAQHLQQSDTANPLRVMVEPARPKPGHYEAEHQEVGRPGRPSGSGDTDPNEDRMAAQKWTTWRSSQLAKKNYTASFDLYGQEMEMSAEEVKALRLQVDRHRKRLSKQEKTIQICPPGIPAAINSAR